MFVLNLKINERSAMWSKKVMYYQMKTLAEMMKSAMRQMKVMHLEKSLVEAIKFVMLKMKVMY